MSGVEIILNIGKLLIAFAKYISPTIGILLGFWFISEGGKGEDIGIIGGIIILITGVAIGQKMEKGEAN